MHIQKIMDITGHSEVAFDPKNVVSVEEAMARFKELTEGKKYRAAKLNPNGEHEVIKEFDPNIEQTLFMPPLMGG